MKQKLILILSVLLLVLCGTIYWLFFNGSPEKTHIEKHIKPVKLIQRVHLHRTSFEKLPGWTTTNDHKNSLLTFQISCRTLLQQNPENNAGSKILNLKVKDWHPACRAALAIPDKSLSNKQAKLFFEHWFVPFTLYQESPGKLKNKHIVKGLFTGYYMPLLQGSLVKTTDYNIPIYGVPDNLVSVNLEQFNPKWVHKRIVGRIENHQLIPFYTRKEITQGALKNHAPVIVWTNSVFDRLILEIEGSGVIQLPNGELLYLGYASGNGAPYTAIGRVLIDQGVLTRDTASMDAIRNYLNANPKKMNFIINQNKSFVFFKILENQIALGAQGVGLTSGYSLAVDRKWIPLGTPLWLNTTHPDKTHQNKKILQRLMIAQDTGGAIRGAVRGDVYWGAGKRAERISGNMRNQGQYWILVPKAVPVKKTKVKHQPQPN